MRPDSTGPIPAPPSGNRPERRYSLRSSLLGLVTACVLPAALVTGSLVYAIHWLQQDRVYRDTVLLARNMASELDREIAAIESGLRVLAASPELADDDLAAFHRRASEALRGQIVTNYLLTDPQGRQRMNTLVPPGQPLPTTGTPVQLQQVFDSGRSVLTDLFVGPVVKRPVIAMGVPVHRGEQVVYSLNVGLSPDRIKAILMRRSLPNGWVAAVLDGSGTIVARNRDSERFVGQKAVPELVSRVQAETEGSFVTQTKEGVDAVSSFSRSAVSSWTVAVGAPKAELERQLVQLALGVAGALATAFGLGLWLALRLAGRVTTAVRELNDAALALGSGQPPRTLRTQLVEADAVAAALVQAGELLEQARHQAHHDALTGLCNRVLFDELLRQQLAVAGRRGQPLAVLALDLDGFKAVNDLRGHAAGDALLKAVADRITATLRASDAAARLGGDEFAVLLVEADAAQAQHTAERLVKAISLPFEGGLPGISASVGVAVHPDSGTDGAELLASADRALYRAKHAGKNRVCGDGLP